MSLRSAASRKILSSRVGGPQAGGELNHSTFETPTS
jgi:hypothetical protein